MKKLLALLLLAPSLAWAQTGSDGLPAMPTSLFNCFAQARFTLSSSGVITPVFWPSACFQSVAGLTPNMDSTYVYNWQKSFPTSQPGSQDAYLAYGWDSHCANCGPQYSQDPTVYSFVYTPATATPAPPTPTPWTPAPSSTPTAAPSTATTPMPIPNSDTVISGWDFGNLTFQMYPPIGAGGIITVVPGHTGNIPPTANPTRLWYCALEQGQWFPLYDTTGAPLPWAPWPGYDTIWKTDFNCMSNYLTQVLGSSYTPPAAAATPWPPPPVWTPAPSGSATPPPWTPSPSTTPAPPTPTATPTPWTPPPTPTAAPSPSASATPVPEFMCNPGYTPQCVGPGLPGTYSSKIPLPLR